MKVPPRLILASQSTRRKEILRFAGITFRIVKPSGVKERRRDRESARQMVLRLALAKAMAVSKKCPRSWVLGADTAVVCGHRIFGKPKNLSQAGEMIRLLQGRPHSVWTGVALVGQGGSIRRCYAEKTKVLFRNLYEKDYWAYLKSREPYDKAGAYDIQGTARSWIKSWEGDYFNVMGLPLRWVIEETNRFF